MYDPFDMDNTEGYTQQELDILNQWVENKLKKDGFDPNRDYSSMDQDYWWDLEKHYSDMAHNNAEEILKRK